MRTTDASRCTVSVVISVDIAIRQSQMVKLHLRSGQWSEVAVQQRIGTDAFVDGVCVVMIVPET